MKHYFVTVVSVLLDFPSQEDEVEENDQLFEAAIQKHLKQKIEKPMKVVSMNMSTAIKEDKILYTASITFYLMGKN